MRVHLTLLCMGALLASRTSRGSAAAAISSSDSATITLDGRAQAHTYDGHGGLSAGASSRLLWDYPSPQRDDILDFLFKPNHGMNLHTIKVEIGGDTQSTDGTEPSHMHERDDYSCDRGYEIWLLEEAKKRNPSIQTYALSWGVPAWVGNGEYFSPDNWLYQTKFAECVRDKVNTTLDYIGIWNERSWGGVDYVVGLRRALDEAGFGATQIVVPDGGYDQDIITATLANASFAAAWSVMGLHYPCPTGADPYPHPGPHDVGKRLWASEDWWQQPDWPSAAMWGRIMNQHYVRANITALIAWSPIWSVYTNLPYQEAGLMRARTPWSGNYDISPPIWTTAQWTQFTKVGWRFLSVPSGGSGFLPFNGSYVSLVDPENPSGGFTLILETFNSGTRCPSPDRVVTQTQTVRFRLIGGLPMAGSRLAVWQTNATSFFQQLADVVVAQDGSFSITIEPETMVTVSTVRTASKGVPSAPIPPQAPFPLPYSENFEGYAYDGLARYFSDQFGSFAVRNGSLEQVSVGNPGSNAWVADADPSTIVGDVAWSDITASVAAKWQTQEGGYKKRSKGISNEGVSNEDTAAASASLLKDGQSAFLVSCDATSAFQKWVWNATGEGYLSNAPDLPSTSEQCLNVYGCGTNIVYWSCVTSGGTCCGPNCYKNLQWTLEPSGALASWLSDSLCATANADGLGGITLAACNPGSPASTQQWSWDAATGLVRHRASGLCLAQPIPPKPRSYVQVCGRVTVAGWNSELGATPEGYCLVVGDAEGGSGVSWTLTAGTDSSKITPRILASGALGSGFDPSVWHNLNLTVRGQPPQIFCALDGEDLIEGGIVDRDPNAGFQAGVVLLGSGYHPAQFDSFRVL